MILQPGDILSILKNKPNASVVQTSRAQSLRLTAHVTGIGNDTLLEKLTGLENEEQLNLRKKYSRSNKDIFARIHRPEDKIFSAKGSSSYYNLPESLKKDFIAKLQNIYNGFSLKKWIENFAIQYFHIDPMGLIFMEVSSNGEQTYPTYKSTNRIFDYSLSGRHVEYVIFTTDEKDIFRVVDDLTDKTIKYDGNTVTEIDVFPNYFGKVPGLIISDIIQKNTEFYTSPDWEIIEIADEYLREGSVKSIYKLKFGYPRQWQYAGICSECNGTGHYKGEDCETCNGSGKSVTKDVSDIMVLPIPMEGQPTIAPNVSGYVSPDIQGWDKMTDEQTLLENVMNQTYWGTHQKEDTANETATGRFIDVQPVNDRLSKFSDWAQKVEQFITDLVGEFNYGVAYKGASITYGKRYLIETPDVIWNKYEDARIKGSPVSVLDDLLSEYYQSKYATDSMELLKMEKLMKVEPFLHLTIEQAKGVVTDTTDFNKKLYYSEWLNQLMPNDVMIKSVSELMTSLTEYTISKNIPETVII
jgi:hypothetical protein